MLLWQGSRIHLLWPERGNKDRPISWPIGTGQRPLFEVLHQVFVPCTIYFLVPCDILIFKKNSFKFLTKLRGAICFLTTLNQKGATLCWKTRTAQKRDLDSLNATQKIAALCEVSFLQKIDKMVLKICQKRIFGQKVNFFIYGTLTRAANFALHSVHQDPYFEV